MRKPTPLTPEESAELAAFEASMNAPRRVFCQHCGTLSILSPDDLLKARCSQCHWPLIMQRIITKKAEPDYTDKKQAAKFLWILVTSIYFVVQCLLAPTSYKILSADDGSLRLVERRWWIFGGRTEHILHLERGEGAYYVAGGEKCRLPEDVRLPANSQPPTND